MPPRTLVDVRCSRQSAASRCCEPTGASLPLSATAFGLGQRRAQCALAGKAGPRSMLHDYVGRLSEITVRIEYPGSRERLEKSQISGHWVVNLEFGSLSVHPDINDSINLQLIVSTKFAIVRASRSRFTAPTVQTPLLRWASPHIPSR
jgi:hypothetical protein